MILVVAITITYIGCIIFGEEIFVRVALILSTLVFLVSAFFPYRYFSERGLRELERVYFNLIIAIISLLASEFTYFLTYVHPQLHFFILTLVAIFYAFFYLFFAFCVASFINFWVISPEKGAIISKVYLASFTLLISFLMLNTYLYIAGGKLAFKEPIVYALASSLDAFFIPLLVYTFHIFRKSIFERSWTLVLAGITMEFLGNFGRNLAIIYSPSIPVVRLFEILCIGGYLIAGYGFVKQIF